MIRCTGARDACRATSAEMGRMRQHRLRGLFFAIAAWPSILCGSSRAEALGPVDLEVAAEGGGGTGGYGAGLGGRVGVAFYQPGAFLGSYLGVHALSTFGESIGGVASRAFLLGAQLGGSFRISMFTIRPYGGVGGSVVYDLAGRHSIGTTYLEPGVLVAVRWRHLIFGVDGSGIVMMNAALWQTPMADCFEILGEVGAVF
jgi:hypothetical protein